MPRYKSINLLKCTMIFISQKLKIFSEFMFEGREVTHLIIKKNMWPFFLRADYTCLTSPLCSHIQYRVYFTKMTLNNKNNQFQCISYSTDNFWTSPMTYVYAHCYRVFHILIKYSCWQSRPYNQQHQGRSAHIIKQSLINK